MNEGKIRVNVDYAGPVASLPFVPKDVETVYLPRKSTISTLLNFLTEKHGKDFEKYIESLMFVVGGNLITDVSTELKDGDWVKFLLPPEGG